MSKKALIVYGGWDGHKPKEVAEILARTLREESFAVDLSDTLDAFANAEKLKSYHLLIPHWTMGTPTKEQLQGLIGAVSGGIGLAGFHGGAGDAFRQATNFQFMIGGQWVAHPGGVVDYKVLILDHADPVTAGLKHFDMHSEQYYMHVDPSNHVLATTVFPHNGCAMPVAWKRMHEKGRVFYCSLGHKPDDFDVPEALAIARRGMLWAAGVA